MLYYCYFFHQKSLSYVWFDIGDVSSCLPGLLSRNQHCSRHVWTKVSHITDSKSTHTTTTKLFPISFQSYYNNTLMFVD